ncbi:hypothetical protein EVAR_56953_1 [Eumeta japonica]|uniref:Uncharacterized protein n=1 Tax=Eumeta variegata TaxID=151549 RepID=A0A4C1YS16_EUMVA|nr:hypothetical protein EVAR_56953_1 [Eumeta japonica]
MTPRRSMEFVKYERRREGAQWPFFAGGRHIYFPLQVSEVSERSRDLFAWKGLNERFIQIARPRRPAQIRIGRKVGHSSMFRRRPPATWPFLNVGHLSFNYEDNGLSVHRSYFGPHSHPLNSNFRIQLVTDDEEAYRTFQINCTAMLANMYLPYVLQLEFYGKNLYRKLQPDATLNVPAQPVRYYPLVKYKPKVEASPNEREFRWPSIISLHLLRPTLPIINPFPPP